MNQGWINLIAFGAQRIRQRVFDPLQPNFTLLHSLAGVIAQEIIQSTDPFWLTAVSVRGFGRLDIPHQRILEERWRARVTAWPMPDRHEIPRADLPRGEPAQGRQFSALAERVIQQERQRVQNAHFR
jgi:hypothetical protein